MPLTNINPLQAPITIAAATTISPSTAQQYYDQMLVFSGAQTVTLNSGLPNGFRLRCRPPASGNASIASDGTVLLNGATTTVTRALSSNITFNVMQIAADSYAVTGS
jgi:hypothetical protein